MTGPSHLRVTSNQRKVFEVPDGRAPFASMIKTPLLAPHPEISYFSPMNPITKITLTGAASILVFDTFSALSYVHLHVPFTIRGLATLILYFGLPYWATRQLSLRDTLLFGAFLGLVDGSAGWKICSMLGADVNYRLQDFTFSRWCQMVIFIMAFGAFFALIAYLTAFYRNTRESR